MTQGLRMTFNIILAASLLIVTQATINATNANGTIHLQTIAEGSLYNRENQTQDYCGTMKFYNNFLYHLDTNYQMEIWDMNTFPISLNHFQINNSNLNYFEVNQASTQIVFIQSGIPNTLQFETIGSNGSINLNSAIATNSSAVSAVYINDDTPDGKYYVFSKNVGQNDSVVVKNRRTDALIISFMFPHSNATYILSHDFRFCVAIAESSNIYIYNAVTFSELYYHPPRLSNLTSINNSIAFNQDCTLMLIETDGQDSVYLIDLINFVPYQTVSYSAPVQGAIIFSKDYVLLLGNGETLLWNTFNTTYAYQFNLHLTINTFAVNYYDGIIYYCNNNTISSLSLSGSDFVPLIRKSNIIDTENKFWKKINLTSTQQSIYDGINNVVADNCQVVLSKSMLFATSLPFTIYFLGFINFLDFICLYVLLNIKIPQLVFSALEALYFSLSTNLVQTFGFNMQLNSFTQNKYIDERALHFGLNSDMLSTNYLIIMLIVANIFMTQIFHFIGNKIKIKKSAKQIFSQDRLNTLAGQVAKLMFSCVQPWRLLVFGGVTSLMSKLNVVIWYVLFLVSFVFQFIYLQQLASKNRKHKTPKTYKYTFSSLFRGRTIGEGCEIISNFIYPFLAFFPNPIIFLILITGYCLIIFLNSFRMHKWLLNSILLSIYPLAFHCCFLIFYFSDDHNTLANAGIVCLITIYVGSIHCLLTIFAEFIHKMIKIIKSSIAQNKIAPLKIQSQTVKQFHKKQLISFADLKSKMKIHQKTLKSKGEKQKIEFCEQGIQKQMKKYKSHVKFKTGGNRKNGQTLKMKTWKIKYVD